MGEARGLAFKRRGWTPKSYASLVGMRSHLWREVTRVYPAQVQQHLARPHWPRAGQQASLVNAKKGRAGGTRTKHR